MKLLAPTPIAPDKMLSVVRAVVGLMMVYHGQEIFDSELMQGYMKWDTFQGSYGPVLVYTGKAAELIAGSLLTLGLLTRAAAVLLACTMAYITFFVGHGRFWYEDQHPFMFVLFAFLFFFTGPGAWSLDKRIFNKKENSKLE